MALWTTKGFIENKVLIQGHRRNTQYTLVYLKQRDELCVKTFENDGLFYAVKVNMVPKASMTFIYANRGLWEQDWMDHST